MSLSHASKVNGLAGLEYFAIGPKALAIHPGAACGQVLSSAPVWIVSRSSSGTTGALKRSSPVGALA